MKKTDAEINALRMRYDKLGPRLVEALKKRQFDAWYIPDADGALTKLISLIPKDDSISWGGSMTMDALGTGEKLTRMGFNVIDRDTAKSPEERHELMRRALTCGTFITGTNAISEDGELVNIDGVGNRVAAMCYGPKQVILLIGMNKVVKTLEDAISRARNTAAPVNVQRFPDRKTPCNITGSCADCKGEGSVCTYIVITRQSKPLGRIKIILIGEDIGF